jgi:hypothetical protein
MRFLHFNVFSHVEQAGWDTFQQSKGLERADEVPQYDADFDAEDDLGDPKVHSE